MSTDWDHESSGLRKENHLFLCVTFYCCCFPWLLNCGLKCSCAPNSLHLLRGYPTKRTKATLAPGLRVATYVGKFFFPIENINVFFSSYFLICLWWGPFCSPSSESRESENVSAPHSVPRPWTQPNGHCRWGHTQRVPSVLREIAYIKWMGENVCHEEEKKNLSVLQGYQGFQ